MPGSVITQKREVFSRLYIVAEQPSSYAYSTSLHLKINAEMISFLYEICPQRIMVVVFFILDWVIVLMNKTTLLVT